jgi:hypothetical protein
MNHLTHKRRECRECGRPLCEGERLLCVGCSVERPLDKRLTSGDELREAYRSESSERGE